MNISIKLVIIFLCFLLLNNFNSLVYAQEKSKIYKPTISIDLDEVLDNYTRYEDNSIPEIRQGAKEFIQKLHESGYNLVLFTNRKPLSASKWLIKNDLDEYFSDVTNIKPMAIIYIDDRALKFEGDYDKTLNQIKDFNVYWKK